MKPAEALEAAADLLDGRPLWKGEEVRRTGADRCVHLAIQDASKGSDLRRFEASELFARYLGLELVGTLQPLFDWNDWEGRTTEQVCKELRACAADLRDAQ